MTATGRLRPSSSSTADKATALDGVLGARVFVEVQIPRTQIAGKMRLVDRAEALALLVEARRAFAAMGMEIEGGTLAAPGVLNEWNCEIAVRHLAIAVRDPSDASKPLAPLDEWRLCDDDQISFLWEEYKDLQDRLDPLAEFAALTEAELAALMSAAKKKPPEIDLLISYGSRKLALFAISMAGPPAS